MKTLTVGILALVGVLLVAGVAAAAPGFAAQPADRPMDGANSPWLNPDGPRAELFQERFGLTDAQMEQIRAAVTEQIQNGADRTEVRATVTEMLGEFGVESPVLGPADGRFGQGAARGQGHGFGHGQGAGMGQTLHDGSGLGTGPHGNGGVCAA